MTCGRAHPPRTLMWFPVAVEAGPPTTGHGPLVPGPTWTTAAAHETRPFIAAVRFGVQFANKQRTKGSLTV